MPFVGKVVEQAAAAVVPRTMCLPLGGSGSAPLLYIDGTAFNNPKRSDVCIPWLVPRAPKGKDGIEQKHSGKKKNKADSVVSHTIEFEDFEVCVGGQKYEYQVPYLVDVTCDIGSMLEGKCLREYLPWDDTVLGRKKPEVCNKTGFMFR